MKAFLTKMTLIFSGILLLSSCSLSADDKDMTQEIYKCIEEQSKQLVGSRFNIYKEYLVVESILLEENILSEKNKRGYKESLIMLFNSTKTDQKYVIVYNKILDSIGYNDILGFTGTLAIPFSCSGAYFEKSDLYKSEKYSKYYNTLKKAYLDFSPDNPNLYLI